MYFDWIGRQKPTPCCFLSAFLVSLVSAAVCGADDGSTVEWRTLEDLKRGGKEWRSGVKIVPSKDGRRAARWSIPPGKPSFIYFNYSTRKIELSEWDILAFDYKFEAKGCAWWGVKIVDYPIADGYQATTQIERKDALTPGKWHTARIDVLKPTWRWGDKPDKKSQYICFRGQSAKAVKSPVIVLVSNIRIGRAPLRFAPKTTTQQTQLGDTLVAASQTRLMNRSARSLSVRLLTAHGPNGIDVTVKPATAELAPGQSCSVQVAMTAGLRGDARPSPLTAHDAVIRAEATNVKGASAEMKATLRVPLPKIQHPCLLIARKDIAKIKAKIERLPWAEQTFDALKRRCDTWLKKTPQFPDRGSQWWHWYSCKKCGVRLKTKSKTEHLCRQCGEVYTGYPYDDVVLSRDHKALANAIRDLGLVYVLTGNSAYAAKSREILMGYAERYLKYPLHDTRGKPTRGGGHVGPQTLDEAVWLIPVAQGFDCIHDTLSEGDVRFIADKMLLPAARHIHAHQWGIHNICCWHASAYGLVAIALGDEKLAFDATRGAKGFFQQVSKGISDDGLWFEGAWGYHYYTMSALTPLAAAFHNIGIDSYIERYKRMYDAPIEFASPIGRLPSFNDSGRSGLGGAHLYEIAYARWRDPRYGPLITRGKRRSLEALLYGADNIPESKWTLSSRIFPKAGFVIFRTNPIAGKPAAVPTNYLVFDYGPHGGGHGHPDKLGFVLHGRGKILGVDPGCIAYGNPAHRGWYKQTLSHNTVVVDHRSQKPTEGKLEFSAFGPNMGLACGRSDGAYPGVLLRRAIAMIGDTILDIYFCSSREKHTYEWAYHNRGELECAVPVQPLKAAPSGDAYRWATDWLKGNADGLWRATWQEDDVFVSLAQAMDGRGEVLRAVGKGQPPSVEVPFVLARRRAADAVYATGLIIGRSPRKPEISLLTLEAGGKPLAHSKGMALELRNGGTRDVFIVRPGGGAAVCGKIELNGRGALLRWRGEKLQSVLVAGNGIVTVDGKVADARGTK